MRPPELDIDVAAGSTTTRDGRRPSFGISRAAIQVNTTSRFPDETELRQSMLAKETYSRSPKVMVSRVKVKKERAAMIRPISAIYALVNRHAGKAVGTFGTTYPVTDVSHRPLNGRHATARGLKQERDNVGPNEESNDDP